VHADEIRLVIGIEERSKGVGGGLFDWLVNYTPAHGCASIDLDSSVQRAEAHRLYFRKCMVVRAFHFLLLLPTAPPVADVMEV
jgi:hypothetical protein